MLKVNIVLILTDEPLHDKNNKEGVRIWHFRRCNIVSDYILVQINIFMISNILMD